MRRISHPIRGVGFFFFPVVASRVCGHMRVTIFIFRFCFAYFFFSPSSPWDMSKQTARARHTDISTVILLLLLLYPFTIHQMRS